jgi:hypothetical protein
MPTARFQMPDGRIARFEVPEGTTPEQAQAAIAAQLSGQKPAAAPAAPAKPFGQQLNDSISDMPRQLGLTARYGLEGAGDALDFIATPFRAGLNAILPTKKPTITDLVSMQDAKARPAIEGRSGETLANLLGLPKPQTPMERTVGDATGCWRAAPCHWAQPVRLPGARPASRRRSRVPWRQTLRSSLSRRRPPGGAGGYTRETRGNDASQLLASLAAGIAAPAAMASGPA